MYADNLSKEATEDDLQQTLGEAGQVESVKIIKDYNTGESRGFGFIEMFTKAEAEKAISRLTGENTGIFFAFQVDLMYNIALGKNENS
ncbi:RNA recognition motif domain-containing protein [Spirochaetota bacterium]